MMIYNKNKKIINESVYRKEQFQALFNYIQQNNKEIIPMNRTELMEYFSINSKPFKLLSQSLKKYSNNDMYNIIIVKTNLSDKQNLEHIITNICESKNEIDIDTLYQATMTSYALFMPSNNKSKENKYKPSILWLNKNNLYLDSFLHEFIHYFEWIDENYLTGNIEDKLYFADINVMNQFCILFNLTSDNLEYIFSLNEYQTLLNDFLNLIENLKNKYFTNYSGNQFARYINFNLMKTTKESDSMYLQRIKDFKYFYELNIIKNFDKFNK